MPLQPIRGTQGLASLLLFDTGNGKLWGENLMKLTGQVAMSNVVIADDFGRIFNHH